MSTSVRPSVVLSLAAIVGLVPFAIDMYLPSLPDIGEEFGAQPWLTQLTLTVYLLLLGVGQLVAGPVSDAWGRRRPLLLGLALFTVGAVLAVFAPTMAVLIAARVLQGIGGAIALVVANSSVRDHASENAATRLYAILLTVAALAPVLAPSLGGIVDDLVGWRGVFVVLSMVGAGATLAAAVFLHESLPQSAREREQASTVIANYRRLLSIRAFVIPMAGFATILTVLFAYIGGASYVYQQNYYLDAKSFGFTFGASGVAVVIGAGLANRLSERAGSRNLAIGGVMIVAAGTAIAAIVLVLGGPLWGVITGMVLVLGGIGASEPALMSICMSAVDRSTGAAAALLGAAQHVLGGISTVIAGSLAAGSAVGWGLMLLVLGVIGAVIVTVCLRTNPSLIVSH